jgi:hypothetical protein
MIKKLIKFFLYLWLGLMLMFWIASWLDWMNSVPYPEECIKRVGESHPFCNPIGGAMDACKSIMQQECFPRRGR